MCVCERESESLSFNRTSIPFEIHNSLIPNANKQQNTFDAKMTTLKEKKKKRGENEQESERVSNREMEIIIKNISISSHVRGGGGGDVGTASTHSTKINT